MRSILKFMGEKEKKQTNKIWIETTVYLGSIV